MGNRVQRVRTEVPEPQMAQAIIEAWTDMFKEQPSKEQVSLVLAQNALETGHRKSMWNYNVGNITTDGKGTYDYFDDLTTDEQIQPGVWKKMNLKYRAYPSLKEGVKDYLRLLSGKRYSNAWEHIKNPDPSAFSKALKQSGYYTANEAPYTKTLTSLFGQFNKSKSYEAARSGQVAKPKDLDQTPGSFDGDALMQKYLAQNKGQTVTPANDADLSNVLNKYLQMVAASEKPNKKLYKKFLPKNDMVISIQSDYDSSVEFARILCAALDEELLADSFTHTDGQSVDVQCSIHGPTLSCFEAVQHVTAAVKDAFKKATGKIGGIEVNTQFIMNKKSSYQQISLNAATTQYRKFLLKFA